MEALRFYAIKITSRKPLFLLLSAHLGRFLFFTLQLMFPHNQNTSPVKRVNGSLTAQMFNGLIHSQFL